MSTGNRNTVHASEFSCQRPLRFFEHCRSCPRFEGCPDLALLTEILRQKKGLNYNRELYAARGTLEGSKHSVDATVFGCLAPLSYLQKTRKECPYEGRCREEGLLLALLMEKRAMDYGQKPPTDFS